jgi:hypothetical protein
LRPLSILLGIALGSAVSLCLGLTLTAVVLLFLPEFKDRFAGEWRPLIIGIAWTMALTGVAAASFVGELRARPWRRGPQWVLAAAIAGLLWIYWP